jgi:hypothetical protein
VTSNRLNGGSAMEGPSFILRRGTTYTFTVSSTGHPCGKKATRQRPRSRRRQIAVR